MRTRLPIEGQRLTIGRQQGNGLVLDDKLASRSHCVIEHVSKGFRLRDLGSSNGTSLNGKPVKESPLATGDVIEIGTTTLRFLLPTDPRASQPFLPDDDPPDLSAILEKPADDSPAEGLQELGVEDIVGDELEEQSEVVPFMAAAGADYEEGLDAIAAALPECGFNENQIELLNGRGQVLHGQGRLGGAARREAVDLFRLLLLLCFRARGTDIHLEPRSDCFQVRLRIDGNMVDVGRLPTVVGNKIVTLAKVMCEIDLGQRNTIQEGSFGARVPPGPFGASRRVDYRASFAPALVSQKLVMRILDACNAPLRLSDLAMLKWMADELSQGIRQDAGMILVAGPTGSGKTTSLYALIRSISITQRNVVTIEDPVEIQIEGVTQIGVNDSLDKSFANILRSVLRQDPDVILVGEVRDAETARTAMQAAITGHLVFSTVHTKDAIGSIFRMLDLGVEPYLVAQGLQLVLSQRLIRQLCRHCKRATPLTQQQKTAMGPAGEKSTQIYVPVGCPRCLGTGYLGRRAVFELLKMSPELREAIIRQPTPGTLAEIASRTHFVPLKQMAFQLVAAGVASFDEADRMVGQGD